MDDKVIPVAAIDIESTTKLKGTTHFAAWPFSALNHIVSGAYTFRGDDGILSTEATYYKDVHPSGLRAIDSRLDVRINNTTLLVGCNIKYDLSFIYRLDPGKVIPRIWDISVAEYLLTGQETKFASLDEMSVKYLGLKEVKDDKIKEYWDRGVSTEDIPKEELLDYNRLDAIRTLRIFEHQYELMQADGLIPLMFSQMDCLRALISMQISGLVIDFDHVSSKHLYYQDEEKWAAAQFERELELDITSQADISKHIFGGTKKETYDELVGKYKNGKDKTKKATRMVDIAGLIDPPKWASRHAKGGYVNIDDKLLQWMKKSTNLKVSRCADLLVRYRNAQKMHGTFYSNILDHSTITLHKENHAHTYTVHPDVHMTSTATGRLSCSNPNLQNQTTEGEVKRSYVSRFGFEFGNLVEFDFSQLELVWLAYQSDDKQLQQDINDDVDIHTALYHDMYGRNPTKEERKAFKPRSFALVYGASARTIAEQAGITKEEAERFIETWGKRYPGTVKWWAKMVRDSDKEKTPYYVPGVPNPKYRWEMRQPTGRKLVFRADTPAHSWMDVFTPTKLKNYPIQSGATADLVPLMVGVCYNVLTQGRLKKHWELGLVRMIMTVHDSILFDVAPQALEDVIKVISETLRDTPKWLKRVFGIDFPCKTEIGVAMGHSWMLEKGEINAR